jgi:hypothetical protein
MTAPPLKPYQLEQEIRRVCQKECDPDELVIGVHSDGEWQGDGELLVGDRRFAVVRADTVLAVREVLATAEAGRRPTILLTGLDQTELGQDVVARLARGKLRRIDLWEGVKRLFRARQLDPALRETGLARALLESKPPDRDYDPVPAGVLDAGTAWRAILHHSLGLEDREPDLAGLLRWAATTAAMRYRESPEDLRQATRSRLAAMLGPAAGSILNIIEAGAARDALALAIACEVVFAEEAAGDPSLQAAAARLERFHLNRPIEPETGRVLARAASDALDDLGRDDPDAARSQLCRADALLSEIQAALIAHLGRRTPLAWDGRLRRFARALAGATGIADGRGAGRTAGLGACEAALERVAEHALAGEEANRGRLERAGLALRLARWLGTPEEANTGSFAQLARHYRDEIAFVDWARDRLAGGDELTELTGAYDAIERAVAARRARFSRAFATALADWTRSGSDPSGVLRVEDVAARVVAKVVGEERPVLLIVLDGMSWPVARELQADLRRLHWAEAALPGAERPPAVGGSVTSGDQATGEPPPPVVAAIPSVTEFSRASLLAGHRHRGRQDDERRLFPVIPALLSRCERNYPPMVFHKGELTQGGRGALAPAVEQAIRDPHRRVVAAVINAVDDRLAGGAQVRETWSVESIRPLGALLHNAREAGRVVILASDHGHVWHRDAPPIPADGAAARWRPATDESGLQDGEVLLEGERVSGPGDAHRLVAAWADDARYGAARNGYHGGASPQEMLAPLMLLSDVTARVPALEPREPRRPAWWDAPGRRRPDGSRRAGSAIASSSPARTARIPAGFLFHPEPPADAAAGPVAADTPAPHAAAGPGPSEAAPGWLGRLVQSPTYQAQRQMVRKFAPEDEVVTRVLEALLSRDSSMTPAALARRIGQSPARLDGLIAKVQRLLNVEGYEVLRLDRRRELVELDVPLLKRQFGLE